MAVDLVTVGLVCADVMVRPVEELPPRGRLQLVPSLEIHVGGLAGVTAAVFSQLGGSAAFVGRLGTDSFGDYLLNALQTDDVDTSGVRRDPDHNSPATVVLISEDGERTFLHHSGTAVTTSSEDVNFDVIRKAKAMHWGGPGVTPGLEGNSMGEVMKQAKELGVLTSVDTCYDGKGVWLPLLEPSLPYLDIVFSSLEEAQKYTGKETPQEIAEFYLSYGPKIALIKQGEAGMYARNAEGEEVTLPSHSVNVVDTTGAGDASCGGFLYAYLNKWPLKDCVRMANAVGALTVQHMGGAEAISSLDDVLAMMED